MVRVLECKLTFIAADFSKVSRSCNYLKKNWWLLLIRSITVIYGSGTGPVAKIPIQFYANSFHSRRFFICILFSYQDRKPYLNSHIYDTVYVFVEFITKNISFADPTILIDIDVRRMSSIFQTFSDLHVYIFDSCPQCLWQILKIDTFHPRLNVTIRHDCHQIYILFYIIA